MREIAFDLNVPWSAMVVVTQLDNVLAQISDMFSKKFNWLWLLLPFEASVPPNNYPVT